MKKNTLVFSLILALMAVLPLTACGPKSTTLNVEMNEFAFVPNTFTVPASTPVTLNLKNTGTLEHEYVIMILGKDATLPFDADDEPNVYWEHELLAGESATVEFTSPSEPGEYQVVCGTPGHLEQGMKGTLIVTQ